MWRDYFSLDWLKQQGLAMIALTLFAVLCLVTLVNQGSALYAARKLSTAERPTAAITPQQTSKQPIIVSTLNLFGQSPSSASNYTSGNIKVLGIFMSTNKNTSSVVISENNSDEAVYFIGDSLPSGAVIKAIDNDKVTISRQGKNEMLQLIIDEKINSEATTEDSSTLNSPTKSIDSLKKIRSRTYNNIRRPLRKF